MGKDAPPLRAGPNCPARISWDQKRDEAHCGKRNDQPKLPPSNAKLSELILRLKLHPQRSVPPQSRSYCRRPIIGVASVFLRKSWVAIEEPGLQATRAQQKFSPM